MRSLLRGLGVFGLLIFGATVAVDVAAAGDDVGVDAYLSIDVVVVGTPPPDASITLLHTTGLGYTPDEFAIALADVVDGPEVVDFLVDGISHGVFVDPDSVGSVDEIQYTCATSGVSGSTPDDMTRCDKLAPAGEAFPVIHAYTQFWGQEEDNTDVPVVERSDITVTVTFDPPCDGREVTVNIARGEVPTAERDIVLGTPSAETLNGRGGNDVICGGGGADTLRGGPGRDRLLGGEGPDRLEGGDDGDTLLGQAGADSLLGQAGLDDLNGGPQRDRCDGGTQRDVATSCEVRTAIP